MCMFLALGLAHNRSSVNVWEDDSESLTLRFTVPQGKGFKVHPELVYFEASK